MTQRPAGRLVAAVVVETPLAHLDRVFEYAVPDELDADAVPGARVRVRFSGRELDGFVVERRSAPQHEGRLTPLRRVVSPEPVLTPEVLALCRAVAERYAGTLSDVLRLAVPTRHATAERNLVMDGSVPDELAAPDPGPWTRGPRARRGGAGCARPWGGALPALVVLVAHGGEPILSRRRRCAGPRRGRCAPT